MTQRARRRSIDNLVVAIGGVWNDVYLTDRLAPGSEDVRAAVRALTEAVEAVGEVARRPGKSGGDLVAIAGAWEAIARAQDLIAQTRHSIDLARRQGQGARAMSANAQQQRARARADRLRRWSYRRRSRSAPDGD